MLNAPSTLLIVDDEPSIRESLSHVLTEVGYRVRSAEDGFPRCARYGMRFPICFFPISTCPICPDSSCSPWSGAVFPAIRTIAMSGSFSGSEAPSGVAADGFYQKGSSIAALLRIMDNAAPNEAGSTLTHQYGRASLDSSQQRTTYRRMHALRSPARSACEAFPSLSAQAT
jgi:DNA-binding NtrC family response regulator